MNLYKGMAVFVAASVLLTSGGVAGSIASATPAHAASSEQEITNAVQQILNDTNSHRAKAGLEPLRLGPAINTVSQNWTEAMANGEGAMHNPSFMSQMPAGWMAIGENIAVGYTPSTVVAAWMASEGHRNNLLNLDYTHIGIGYWVDDKGQTWFTQNFGAYQVPEIPTGIATPTINAGTNSFTANWNSNDPSTTYHVKITSTKDLVEQSVTVKSPSATFSNLQPDTTYRMTITAEVTDATGVIYTAPSSGFTVKTLTDFPVISAPALTVGTKENAVTAKWQAPTTVTGTLMPYKVELLKDNTVVQTTTTTGNEHMFSGLEALTTYTVRVTATATKSGNSVSAVSEKIAPTTGPDLNLVSVTAPSFKSSTPAPTSMALTWNAPTGVTGKLTGYTLTVKSTSEPDRVFNTTGTSYTVTGLKEGTSYNFVLVANATSLNGAKKASSTPVSLTKSTTYLPSTVKVSAPRSLTAKVVSHERLDMTWAAPSTVVGSVSGYKVTVKAGNTVAKTMTVTGTSASVTGLKPSTAYTVEVAATAVSPDKKKTVTSAVVTAKATTSVAPVSVKAPVVNVGAVGSDRATVSWAKPAVTNGKVASYKVTVKQGSKVVKTYNVSGTATSVIATGLSERTAYTAFVEVTAEGTKTQAKQTGSKAFTTTLSTASQVKVGTPASLTTSTNYGVISVSWKRPAVTGTLVNYTVQLKEGSKVVKTITTTATSSSLTGLKNGTKYQVSVKANAKSANGKYAASSAWVSKTVSTPTVTASTVRASAPVALKTTTTRNSLTATWGKPTSGIGKVANYTVVVYQGNKAVKTVTTTSLRATVSGLKANTAYKVTVKANFTSSNGKVKASSAVVSQTPKTLR